MRFDGDYKNNYTLIIMIVPPSNRNIIIRRARIFQSKFTFDRNRISYFRQQINIGSTAFSIKGAILSFTPCFVINAFYVLLRILVYFDFFSTYLDNFVDSDNTSSWSRWSNYNDITSCTG